MIFVAIETGAFRNAFGAILSRTQRRRTILQAACRAGRKVLQSHFRERDRTPNRLGGRRTHFWLDVYKSTQLGPVDDAQGVINISDPRFAQKLRGGTIIAKNVKNLSIPVSPEAHGRRPAVLERELGVKLFFIKPNSTGLLAHRLGEGEDATLKVDYVLKPSVTQDADPLALPNMTLLEDAALNAAQAQLDRELAQATATT